MKKTNSRLTVPSLILLATLLDWSVCAATYWVNSTLPGSDSNAGTSPSTAWLTLNKATTTAVSNDVVYVVGGTPYNVTMTIGVGGVKYLGTNVPAIWNVDGNSKSDITLSGFTIVPTSHAGNGIGLDGCNRWLIQNCIITNTSGDGIHSQSTRSYGNTVRSNYLYSIGTYNGGQGSACVQLNGSTNLVEYNIFGRYGDGAVMYGVRNIIQHNFSDDVLTNYTAGFDDHPDFFSSFDSVLTDVSKSNLCNFNYCRSNMMQNSHFAIAQDNGAVGLDGFNFIGNVITRQGSYALIDDRAANVIWAANTVDNTFFNVVGADTATVYFENAAATNGTAYGNIYNSANNPSGGTIYGTGPPPGPSFNDYDNYNNSGTPTPSETHGVSGSPLFVSSTDLHLQSGSPARNINPVWTTANGAGAGSTSLTVNNARYFWGADWGTIGAGCLIQITNNAAVRVTAVNFTTKVLTLANAQTWSSGDWVTISGFHSDAGALPYKAGGFSILSTNTLVGLVNTVTAADTSLIGQVEFYENLVLKSIVYDAPYVYTGAGGTVDVVVRPYFADMTLGVTPTQIVNNGPLAAVGVHARRGR